MDYRDYSDRRRSTRRAKDLIKIKRTLAIGLAAVAAISFASGYLAGCGALDVRKPAAFATVRK